MSKAVKSYAFRAEFEKDVDLFLNAIRKWTSKVDIEKQFLSDDDGTTYPIPDREVVMKLTGNLSLPNMRWIADQIIDCHVISETLETSKKYTGDRTYLARKATEAPNPEQRQHIREGLEHCVGFFESELERVYTAIESIDALDVIDEMHKSREISVVPATQRKQIGSSKQAS